MRLSGDSLTPLTSARMIQQLDFLVRTKLWAQILLAMLFGITVGLLLSPSGGAVVDEGTANLIAAWLALPGRLFLALIQMVVVPLVLTSIVMGITSSGDSQIVKQVGTRIAPYFVCTTLVAVIIGAALALWMQPSQYLADSAGAIIPAMSSAVSIETLPETRPLTDRIIDIVPVNPTSAILQRAMFQIVIMAIMLSIALVSIPPQRAKPILDLCVSLQDVSMTIVGWAMALAPVAVFGLLAQVSVEAGPDALLGVSAYMGTVILGLLLLLVFYLLIATTVGASIGAPSTPGVGIVILATIVQGLGVPPQGVALILGVDRILDMTRTAVNVSGDLTASVVMDRWFARQPDKTTVQN